MDLPLSFKRNVRGVCGSRGEAWLGDLPLIISGLERRWKIIVEPNFPNLSYNYVAPAMRADGTPVVLKLGLPADDGEFDGETAYLRHMNGEAVVRIVDEDTGIRALLLQRAIPGDHLREAFAGEPVRAVDAAITTLKRLARKPPADQTQFTSLERWANKLSAVDCWDFPRAYAQRASEILETSHSGGHCLLHGDFHHENILSNGPEAYLVIDPKGLIGDIKYDIAAFLNNHGGWLRGRPDLKTQLDTAVKNFADAFGISPLEIRRWAFAQKVLGAFWTCTENGGRWRDQLASADVWGI